MAIEAQRVSELFPDRRSWCRRFALTLLLLWVPILPAQDRAERPPNIVILLADDLGYGDLGCYGSKEAMTPNIDGLAKQGVRLTDFYVTTPSCTPTRGALLTGRYPQRSGCTGTLAIGDHPAFNGGAWRRGLDPSEVIIPERLKDRGYASAVFGKWHIGHRPGQRPQDRGFETSLINLAGHVDFFTGLFFGEPDIYRDGEQIEFSGYTTDAYADAAIEFMVEHRDQPFFVYLPFNAVHWSAPTEHPGGETQHGQNEKYIVQAPTDALARFAEHDEHRQHCLAALSLMDQAVGRVLKSLDDQGLAEETLVIFFSDNGGSIPYGGTNGSLRGQKGTLWEGGIRVPAMARWPGRIPAGSVVSEPLIQMDFFHLAMAVSGAGLPEDRVLDGRDPLPTLTGKAPSPHEALVFRYGNQRAIRMGDYKLRWTNTTEPQLFDLSRDPGESRDLAPENPELVQRLRDEHQRRMTF